MAAGGRHFPRLRPPRLGGGAAAALVLASQGARGGAGLRQVPPPPQQCGPPPSAAAVEPGGPAAPMAAEPQPKALTRKPLLLNKVEGSQEVVNMAAIVPKEDGVISVSEDRSPLKKAVQIERKECQLGKQLPLIYEIAKE